MIENCWQSSERFLLSVFRGKSPAHKTTLTDTAAALANLHNSQFALICSFSTRFQKCAKKNFQTFDGAHTKEKRNWCEEFKELTMMRSRLNYSFYSDRCAHYMAHRSSTHSVCLADLQNVEWKVEKLLSHSKIAALCSKSPQTYSRRFRGHLEIRHMW